MLKIVFILFILLINGQVLASDWNEITPLPHCEKFKVEYQKRSDYHIRYRVFPNSPYDEFQKPLNDINDLSELADELISLSYNYCPLQLAYTEVDDEYECTPLYISPDDFGDEFTKLYEAIIASTRPEIGCDNVIPLINLQNKISSLNQKQILTFEKSDSGWKIFTGKANDIRIDHYYNCGGKKKSDKFIKNMILLEAKKACVFPAPPGLLETNEAIDIAAQIAQDYDDMDLVLQLSGKVDEIKRRTVLEFSDRILKKKGLELFGDKKTTSSIINSLASYNRLKRTNGKLIEHELKYGFSPDVSFEMVDEGLPFIVYNSFADQLPKEMSKQEKEVYLDRNIIPNIRERYNKCITPYKERIMYPAWVDNKFRSEHRKNLESNYCNKNPKDCERDGCGKKINFLTDKSDIEDIDIIQSCLLPGMAQSLKPLIAKTLDGQFKELGKDLSLSDLEKEEFKKESYNSLIMCADRKIKELTGEHSDKLFTEDSNLLLKIDAKEFTDTLLVCGKEVEKGVTRDLSVNLVSNIEQIKDQYSKLKIKDGHIDFARELTDRTLAQCLSAQAKRVNAKKQSAKLCVPMIEVQAGSEIIQNTLRETLGKEKIDPTKIKDTTDQFEQCTQRALSSNAQSYYNSSHSNPIRDGETASKYLEENNEFYSCVKDSINKTTELIATKKLSELSEGLQNQAQDPSYVELLKPMIKAEVTKCMRKELNKIPHWKAFAKLNKKINPDDPNEKTGFDNIQKKCADKGADFALPRIIANETSIKLSGLKETKLTSLAPNDLALLIAESYEVPYNPEKEILDKVLLRSFKKYKNQHPDKEIDDFVEDFTAKAQSNIVGNIGSSLLDRIINENKPEYQFGFLKNKLDENCLNTFYNYNKDLIPLLNSDNITWDLEQLFKELETDNKLQFKNETKKKETIEKLNRLCKEDPKDKKIPINIMQSLRKEFVDVSNKRETRTRIHDILKERCKDKAKKEPVDLQQLLVDLIGNGLKRAKKQNRLADFEADLVKMCKNPKKYQNINELVQTGLIDDVVLKIVEEKTVSGFKLNMQSMCFKDAFEYMIYLAPDIQSKMCSPSKEDLDYVMARLGGIKVNMNYDQKLPLDKFVKFEFIFKRHYDSITAIDNKLNSDLIDRMFHKDKDLLNKIYNNFPGVTKKYDEVIKDITKDVVIKVFEQDEAGGFTDDLMRAQLVGAVGLVGHNEAKGKLDEFMDERSILLKAPGISGKIEKRAEPTFYRYWRYDKIQEYMDWDDIPENKRKALIQDVFEFKVLPEYSGKISNEQAEENFEQVKKIVNDHVEQHRPFTNPKYNTNPNLSGRSKRQNFQKRRFLNLAEKLAQDIQKDISDGVKSDLKNQFSF